MSEDVFFAIEVSIRGLGVTFSDMRGSIVALGLLAADWSQQVLVLSDIPVKRESMADRNNFEIRDSSGGTQIPQSVVTIRNAEDPELADGALLEVRLNSRERYTVSYSLEDSLNRTLQGSLEITGL